MTRRVPEGEYLLERVKIEVKGLPSDISKSELQRYILDRPNNRILGHPFGLYVYNWAKPGAETGFHGWLRRIGSPPVLFSQYTTDRSTENLSLYLRSRGYHHCQVSDTVIARSPKKKRVTYRIDLGEPTRISDLSFRSPDSSILIQAAPAWESRSLLPGHRLDIQLLQEQAKRMETHLRNQGFYNFSSDYVGFVADTLNDPYRAKVTFHIPPVNVDYVPPKVMRRYRVDSVVVLTRHNPLRPLDPSDSSLTSQTYRQVDYRYPARPGIRLRAIDPMLLLRRDSILREGLLSKSQENILGMGLYQQASMEFRERDPAPFERGTLPINDSLISLGSGSPLASAVPYPANGVVRLVRRPLQGYQVELLLTTSGAMGMRGGLTYYHRNLFNGAELLEVSFNAQVEALRKRKDFSFKAMQEYTLTVGLTFPAFLFPYAPREYLYLSYVNTRFNLSFNYQERPDYTRYVLQSYVGYNWQYNTEAYRSSHSLVPATVSLVRMVRIDPLFAQHIAATYLGNSYISQLVTATTYTFTYRQQPTRFRPSVFSLRGSVELSGNTLSAAYYMIKGRRPPEAYRIGDLPFSQYVRGELNLAYLWVITSGHAIAFRLYGGVGYPYGNSKALPFEKKFYQGGANGVRAWHARDLGPGTYYDDRLSFPNQTADLKLEANVEYRFGIHRRIEGALFFDAGNIWSIREDDPRPGAQISADNFFSSIALGYGTGIRFNLGFFVLRLDLGVKLYDPALRPGPDGQPMSRWRPANGRFDWGDFVLNFGVGSPF